MDPLLRQIIESAKSQPPGGEYRLLKPEMEDPMAFAAPTRLEAKRRLMRAILGLDDPKSTSSKIQRALEILQAVNMPVGPGGATPAIFAGVKGAARVGGETAVKFAEGEMAAVDVAPQRLWRELGYERGAEGKGRFEISDVPARATGVGGQTTVGRALEHPELYKAYPGLADIPLHMKIGSLESSGRYIPRLDEIHVSAYDLPEAKSNLLHELQHAVQRREGHATGANLQGGEDAYLKSAGEQEAYNVQRRLSNSDLMRFAPSTTETMPREMQLVKQDPAVVAQAAQRKKKKGK